MGNEKPNRLHVGPAVFVVALFLGVFGIGLGFGVLAFVFNLGNEAAASMLAGMFPSWK